MVLSKYLNPRNDIAFKRLFGQEKNKDILLAMLNSVAREHLHKPLEEVEFLSPNLDPDVYSQKQSILDVLCKDQDGCQYIIEMQNAYQKGFEERIQYYACKTYVTQAESGMAYINLKRVIFLAFCDFDLFPHDTHYKSVHRILNVNSQSNDLKKLAFTFVSLPRFEAQRKQAAVELSLEEKFYYFLHHAQDLSPAEQTELRQSDQFIERAFDELERFHWDEATMRQYEAVEKIERDNVAILAAAEEKGKQEGIVEGKAMGKQEGIVEGKAMGKQEEKVAIAGQMLRKGMPPSLVAEVTGLSLEAVAELMP